MVEILVVDDEAAIADLVEVCLKNEGYTVYKCGSGEAALTCVARQHLDLAILDVMLPDLDGFTLCQKIREEHLFPILMITARVEDMDKIMGLTLGADDYITKPFNPLELVARVFDNLLRNAFHYSFPGSTVRITGQQEADTVVLTFTNEGRTIPAEKLERIFDQFFRLDSSRATRTGGAGLGLAIAKEILALHGGTIRAASADNRITFTVRLPLQEAAARNS